MSESNRSESIMNLVAALAIAQGQIKSASKDAQGNYSKYSTLDSIWDACRIPLSENGLSVIQMPETGEGELILKTILCHLSGEWISSTITLPIVVGRMNEHQALGGAITYARRYSLAAMVGVASGDDDDAQESGEKLTRQSSAPTPAQPQVKPLSKQESLDNFIKMASKEFGLEKQDIFDELKEAGFSGFKQSETTKMWNALKRAQSAETENNGNGDHESLEELYPEILGDEADQPPLEGLGTELEDTQNYYGE